MNTNKAIGLLFCLLLQGCNRPPSASDVETAVKADYADCQNLSVENVKLLNGLKINDISHQVSASFDVRVIPLPNDLVEATIKANEQYSANQKQYVQEYNETYFKKAQLSNSNMQARVFDASKEEDRKTMDEIATLAKDLQDLEGKLNAPKPASVDSVIAQWGSPACRSKSGVEGNDFVAAVSNGAVTSLSATFVMNKTDNGWMEEK